MDNIIAQGLVDCITNALIPTSSFAFVSMLLLLGILFCLCSISAKLQKFNQMFESELKEKEAERKYLGVPFKLKTICSTDKNT